MISALILSLVPVPGDVDVFMGEPIPGATGSAVPEAMAPTWGERWARCGSSQRAAR
ncbi:MAG: hypothetical protein AAF726_24605 [Planctomycetota bacterium]